jgi:hypothetical protein
MAHTPTIAALERLLKHHDTPEPLRGWLLEECRWLDSDGETRRLLCAAVEGWLGIPTAHRENSDLAPLWAAAELCRRALANLSPWWDVDKRAGFSLKAQQTEDAGRMLGCWVAWRALLVKKRNKLAAAAKVTTADRLPAKAA